MPGFDDCRTCDFRDRPEACWALRKGIRHLCRERFRRVVWEQTTDEPWPHGPEVAEAAPPLPEPGPGPTPEPVVQPSYTPEVIGAARDCPDRGAVVGHACGCRWECRKGLGWFDRGVVSHHECLECKSGRPPTGGTDPVFIETRP